MKKVLLKSIIYGCVVGSIFFAIAPLGLGIYMVEILKPVLVPGILITQLILENSNGNIAIVLSVILNGVIYSMLFVVYFASQARVKRR